MPRQMVGRGCYHVGQPGHLAQSDQRLPGVSPPHAQGHRGWRRAVKFVSLHEHEGSTLTGVPRADIGQAAAPDTRCSNLPFAPPANAFPNISQHHRARSSYSAPFSQILKTRFAGARVVHGVCTLFTPPESQDFQILTPVLRARLTRVFSCLRARSAPSFPPRK